MVHEANAHLQTRRHELIPARQLLTVLQKTPCPSLGADVEIGEEDHAVYRPPAERTSNVDLALKYINSRKAGEDVDADSEVVGGNRAEINEISIFFASYVTIPDQNFAHNPSRCSFRTRRGPRCPDQNFRKIGDFGSDLKAYYRGSCTA